MAKKIVAKTNISYGTADGESVKFEPGDEVDAGKHGMTKEQLEQLYDAGAIELQETVDKREKAEKEEQEAKEAADKRLREAAKTEEEPAPDFSSVVPPAKATPAKDVKSSGTSKPA